MTRLGIAFAMLSIATVGLAGCHRPIPTTVVNDALRRGDRPLANVRVELVPAGSSKGRISSYGITDAAGKFQLHTYDGRSGAAVGKHRIVLEDASLDDVARVSRATEDDPESPLAIARESTIDARFRHVHSSPIEIEVGEDPASIEIDLQTWE